VTRKLTALLLWGVAAALLPGHSPYRQWYAYRAKHLVIVTDESRPGALDAANAVASAVAAKWPELRPVAAAARSTVEVVKLLASGQLQIGLVPPAAASDALQGRGAFAATGKVPLRAVAAVGEDVLVVVESCPRERVRAVAQALGKGARPGAKPPIPFHPAVVELESAANR
jgi:TRAP-type uncharacterized transport system substrate-binding protein